MRPADLDSVQVKDASELRRWFEKNHAVSDGIWLIVNKKNNTGPGVTYENAVEEALAFGWIDGRINSIDDKRYRQMFTPRRKGGTWAKSNKARVEKLIAEGRMTEAGLARIDEAKKDGSWDALDSLDEIDLPPDLAAALGEQGAARAVYDSWSESYRKRVIWWVITAKRPETRSKRIFRVAEAASKRTRPFE